MNACDQTRRQMLRGTLATLCALAVPLLFGCNKRETPPNEPAPAGPTPGAGTTTPSGATPEPAPPAPQPADGVVRVAKASVQYQDQPKGDQKCSNCLQFVEPDGCKVVEGPINPDGWCILWAKKA